MSTDALLGEWEDVQGLDVDDDLCKDGWAVGDVELLTRLLAASPPRSALLLDFSYAKPNLQDLLAYGGIIGYLSPNPGKNLPVRLAQAMLDAGREVALVWQAGATGPLGGPRQGALDAREADRQAAALARATGHPNDALPIRFANDFAPLADQRRTIEGYFLATEQTTERPHADGYGNDVLLDWVNGVGVPATWQTRAWSGGRVSRYAGLLQQAGAPFYGNPGGVAVDENVRVAGRPFPTWRRAAPAAARSDVVGMAWHRPV